MTLMKKAAPFLKEGLSIGTAMKGLASVDPRLRSFIYAASLAGYGTDMVMDFLRGSSGTPQDKNERRLKQREASGMARSDEKAQLSRGASAEGAQDLIRKGAQAAAGLASASGVHRRTPEEEVTESVQEVATPQGYFERAMEGIKFADLTPEMKPNVVKFKDRLDILERQQVPYEDDRVQKFVRALKKLVGGQDIGYREQERFNQTYGGDDADARFNAILDQVEPLLRGLLGG